MTMHSDHHVTETEDAAFDATMKIMGIAAVLLVGTGLAFWYLYA